MIQFSFRTRFFDTYVKIDNNYTLIPLPKALEKGVWGETLFGEKVSPHNHIFKLNYFVTTPLAMRYLT